MKWYLLFILSLRFNKESKGKRKPTRVLIYLASGVAACLSHISYRVSSHILGSGGKTKQKIIPTLKSVSLYLGLIGRHEERKQNPENNKEFEWSCQAVYPHCNYFHGGNSGDLPQMLYIYK